jgi:hypothetical protein
MDNTAVSRDRTELRNQQLRQRADVKALNKEPWIPRGAASKPSLGGLAVPITFGCSTFPGVRAILKDNSKR